MQHLEPTATNRDPRRALELICEFLVGFGAFTICISAATMSLAPIMLLLDGPAAMAPAAILVALALYGLGCAGAMFICLRGLCTGRPEAARWTQLTMIASIPGSLIAGTVGAMKIQISLDSIQYGEKVLGAIMIVISSLIVLAALANVAVLIRLVLRNDLNALLWSDLEDELHVGMNYDEPTEE